MLKYLPNIITLSRIITSCLMIFVPTLSKKFYLIYSYSGISDVLDGFVARKTNNCSETGRKLDSFADLLFYGVMMFKIMPYLIKYLPRSIWHIINITLIIRLILYLVFGLIKHQFLSNHTIINKITGVMLFFIPFVIKRKIFIIYSLCVSIIALFAAIYEIIIMYKRG